MNTIYLIEYLPIVKDAVIAAAAVIGAYVALRGLSTWNRQLKGGVEYDLTRRILKCTYRLREAIKGVRNPVMWGNEMPIPEESEASKMTRDQLNHYGKANAYKKRWDIVSEVRADLQTEMLEAEAIWGRIIYEEFEPLFKLQQELHTSVYAYVSGSNPNESEQTRFAFNKILQNHRDILYDLSTDKPDDYSQNITQAIEGIESFLKVHLRK
jgi:hypothetical protein